MNGTVLITGGSGSFGTAMTERLLRDDNVEKIIIFSRGEYAQHVMRERFKDDRLRFFIGDVRDADRLHRAFTGVDYVIHAAALKQVPACEYNPFEAVLTNIHGAKNVIDAAIDRGVKKVIALSTDKAANPINLYGATKLCSDKLFVAGNAYSGGHNTRFSVVRYGNVAGSRGSVIPLFKDYATRGEPIPITDLEMTRFWITLEEATEFVERAFIGMGGGEIFVPKIPSFKVVDLAEAINPGGEVFVSGIRQGEKLHEVMISLDDSRKTIRFGDGRAILSDSDPLLGCVEPVESGFSYSSDNNTEWLTVEDMRRMVEGM